MTREEEYLEGRRSGVEGTYGAKRAGTAEKTVVTGGADDGGGASELTSTASRLYRNAVDNRGDSMGDKAMTER
jgi:hypothetical protein